jgi:hypothetical protein
MPGSPVVTVSVGTYTMDLVLRTKGGRPKSVEPRTKGSERCRWTNWHSGIHILATEDAKQDHCGCEQGKMNPA